MSKGNALVVSANRGLGLALVKELISRGYTVYGTIRPETEASDPSSYEDLKSTTAQILHLDILSEPSIISAASSYPSDKPLDLLINNAGLGVPPMNWQDTSAEIMIEKFKVNTVGPFLTMKHFWPALERSECGGRVVNITSDMASLKDSKGYGISYRVSKAALNQVTRTVAIEVKTEAKSKVTVNAIHPGWFQSKLSNFTGPFTPETQATKIADTIERFTQDDTGRYVTAEGEDMAW